MKHTSEIIQVLKDANMKISLEKSKFFQKEVEFLGYRVAHCVIRTDPEKVKAIQEYPAPTTFRQLRSFLGMAGYYRKFVKNYARVARLLTKYLSGENGRISQHRSKKVEIVLNKEAISAFRDIKKLLTEKIELVQPDYDQTFMYIDDGCLKCSHRCSFKSGRQTGHSISKTLNSTERNYATNEKELYAIVWALKNLRNYLYGATNLEIHTDHQPLTFAVSSRNAIMKR